MTSRSRYLAALAGRPADFIPRIPILMQFAAEHIGRNYAAFASDHRVLTDANLACARDFGLDQVSTISDPYRETQGFGATIVFEPNAVPRPARHPLEDTLDLTALPRPDPQAAPRMRDRIDAIRRYRALAADAYSILGWVEGPAAEAAALRRLDNFFLDLLDDPDRVGALMDRCVDTAIDFAAAQVRAGADTIGIGDAAASQLSPDLYRPHVLPRQRRLIAAVKDLGAFVRLHICGNITHLLPDLATLPIDILDLDHLVDLRGARQILGPRLTLAGNLDPVSAVLQSTPEVIRRQVLDCYAQAGPPFMVAAGCEIPARTPPENLRALCAPISPASR